MNKIDRAIADSIITHTLDIYRLTAAEQKKAQRLLLKMQKELIGKLANEKLDAISKKKIQVIIDESEKTIQGYYVALHTGIGTLALGLSTHTAKATAKALVEVGLDASLPTETHLKSILSETMIEGSPAKDWWAAQADGLAFKFSGQVRQGIIQGESTADIAKRLSPIFDTTQRGASALVHTQVQTIANDARLATFRANDDVIKGVEQLSTLDSHTSTVCVAYSGAKWDLDGNPIEGTTLAFNGGPPRHIACRSVLVPITKSFAELGSDLPAIPKGTRASEDGQISADTTFTKWLSNKSTDYQDELLGKGRAKLYREGKITLSDLVNQKGRPLTLEQLQKKYD